MRVLEAARADSRSGWLGAVPRDEMRELSTDRPDMTESPCDDLGGGSAIAWGSSAQVALGLPHGFDLGSMLELETEDGTSLWLATLTFGHDLVGPLGGYLEVSAARPTTGDRELQQTFNSGLTWAVTPDVQLDAGTVVGTTQGADDFVGFLGITVRR